MLVRNAAIAVAFVAIPAGCGGAPRATPPPPKLPHDLATQLATLSDQVAAQLDGGNACAAFQTARQLDTRTVQAIDSGRVPVALQQPLRNAAGDLAGSIHCTPPPPKDHGKHEGHGKHKRDGGGD
jgi:hypothetical protein